MESIFWHGPKQVDWLFWQAIIFLEIEFLSRMSQWSIVYILHVKADALTIFLALQGEKCQAFA